MALQETPPLLMLGTQEEYIQRIKDEYHNKPITLPEGKQVLFFLGDDSACKHAFCGKDGYVLNKFRAQRILWVRFLLENEGVRVVKKATSNNFVVFYCEELGYMVICHELKKGDLKFVTQYIVNKKKAKDLADESKYQDIDLRNYKENIEGEVSNEEGAVD